MAEGAADAVVGDGCSVITEYKLELVHVIAYLRAVFETAGVATVADSKEAETDLCADEELFSGIEARADKDRNLTDRRPFDRVAGNVVRFSQEGVITGRGYAGQVVQNG